MRRVAEVHCLAPLSARLDSQPLKFMAHCRGWSHPSHFYHTNESLVFYQVQAQKSQDFSGKMVNLPVDRVFH